MKEVRRAEQDVAMEGAVMQAQLRQSQKEELKREVLDEILPALTRIHDAATGNKDDREMIASMTADNVTMTAKMEAIMAENARMMAETKRMKTRLEAMERNHKTDTTHIKTEPRESKTELNSSGEECQVKKGTGRMKKFWFFKDQQYCANCKKMTYHLPSHCPELPERKKRKADTIACSKAEK